MSTSRRPCCRSKINFADFQDPAKLQKFLQRFSVMWETANGQANSTTVPSILINQPAAPTGVSAATLASLQNLKFGR